MKNFTLKNQKNINTKEIKLFNFLASQWWNPNGTFRSLHNINYVRLEYIIKYSGGLFKKRILDIGCGGGLLSESMTRLKAQVTGLDVSFNSIKIAQLHAVSQKLTIKYILKTAEKHALTHINYYDIITCMEVLEHVPNPASIINACNTMIKKNGSVFFSTLNRTYKSWLFAIMGAEYIFNLIPKGTHTFKNFITPSELLKWIDHTHLKPDNIAGIYYNPFTNNCKITHDLSINYILHNKRII